MALLLNDQTNASLDSYLNNPGQSVGLIGPQWLNKTAIAEHLAKSLLKLDDHKLENYAYILRVTDPAQKSIGIDEIRRINGFIKLKVPIKQDINRVVLVEQANLMTKEAQNALLKSLEEPPGGTVFILTASSIKSLLPTIISRLQIINVLKPLKVSLIDHYTEQGHEKSEIEQAYLISGGLPGLMDLMLNSDDHPLNQASQKARQLLLGTTFDRLNAVNELAKNKDEFKNILFIIKQMAKIGLNSNDTTSVNRWQKILNACLDSEAKLSSNVQTKLLLTNFMLSIA